MPSTTARLGLPIPLDSDPFEDGATATRNLGNAVDDLIAGKARRGSVATNTNASGQVLVNHGLGVAPTSVQVTNTSPASSVAVAVSGKTSTQFMVTLRFSSTGAVIASSAVTFDWLAVV